MHIISRKKLREFCQNYADSCDALKNWYKAANKATWNNLAQVQAVYPQTEAVGNSTVFNIKGNKYRLISCPLDCLLKPKNPTPPKLRFVSPPRKRGGVGGGV
ncbi:hypothetical protein CDG76_05515 [Nostoc sp. 'Peltigera membranacea cyanobiont' 210A]|uniref:type II toxin-antitoxin system HigB family toxin n=1 Tax=Nostoc sp. 'Peltigera membranacea cyanobiont' 210A TaxID=2014529 RepID=UPI000B95C7E0|nr:type II toxin-antitoxin system HigB family toxin [Nostoc sp. 'Peltigera membranacea cyanobiont' 210A]OYD96273.1 hypothetical protein CDG76_05515 [Nostoc sp. 'Peltigera membranacea cyanobiont' 210A]